MEADSDLVDQPDARSAALRAVKDISFGSVSRLSVFFSPYPSSRNDKPPFFQIAGIVSKVFEHPFDLCKVRLQTQVLDQMARFSGPIDCLTKTWKHEGFRGLYRVRIHFSPCIHLRIRTSAAETSQVLTECMRSFFRP